MCSVHARTVHNDRPLLSVCIPTYNRAVCLERLLACLQDIVARYGDAVQVCLSDNHSSDGTAAVIASWLERFAFDAVTQSANIGATRNIVAVVGLARGRWILLVGDDDLVEPAGLESVLARLREAREDDWVLAGVGDDSGRETLLQGVTEGRYTPARARRLLRRIGLQRMGFMGMHVFPASSSAALTTVPPESLRPWPQLALLLRHVVSGGLIVSKTPLVRQAGAGKALFWKQGDWMRVLLRLLDIVDGARDTMGRLNGFYDGLFLRQLYDADALKGMMYWRFFEPADFRETAAVEYARRYRLLRWRAPLALGHAVVLAMTWCLPRVVFTWVERVRGRGDSLERYIAQREGSHGIDGVQRGL